MSESLPDLIATAMSRFGVQSVRALYRRLPDGADRMTYETFRKLSNGEQRGVRDPRVVRDLQIRGLIIPGFYAQGSQKISQSGAYRGSRPIGFGGCAPGCADSPPTQERFEPRPHPRFEGARGAIEGAIRQPPRSARKLVERFLPQSVVNPFTVL